MPLDECGTIAPASPLQLVVFLGERTSVHDLPSSGEVTIGRAEENGSWNMIVFARWAFGQELLGLAQIVRRDLCLYLNRVAMLTPATHQLAGGSGGGRGDAVRLATRGR